MPVHSHSGSILSLFPGALRYTHCTERGMKLLTKFNLILIALFGAGSLIIAVTAYRFLMQNARSQVVQQAELMIESARSTRQYTTNELAPLLETLPEQKTRFLPEIIPFYAATVTFDYLRKQYPQYSYKEAALNPSNLRDRAVDWEADLISYFRNHPSETELVGERDSPTGRMLYIARPIPTEQACMACHGQPTEAPPTIIQTYGTVNGFGWKANETVSAQIVSVPMALPIQIAHSAFRTLIIYLLAGFILSLAALDAAIVMLVIRPVSKLSGMADRISNGDMSLPELTVQGNDEISALTASFNRMFVSLQKAFRMLNG
jgi:HAMP domain-containing protein